MATDVLAVVTLAAVTPVVMTPEVVTSWKLMMLVVTVELRATRWTR
jgi:hypothetical protein